MASGVQLLSAGYITSPSQISPTGAGIGTLVGTYDFASDILNITGLTGDNIYTLLVDCTSSAGVEMLMQINADTTETHYGTQYSRSANATNSAGRRNTSSIGSLGNGLYSFFTITISKNPFDSKAVGFITESESTDSANTGYWRTAWCKYDATITAITSIKLLGNGAATITGKGTLFKQARS